MFSWIGRGSDGVRFDGRLEGFCLRWAWRSAFGEIKDTAEAGIEEVRVVGEATGGIAAKCRKRPHNDKFMDLSISVSAYEKPRHDVKQLSPLENKILPKYQRRYRGLGSVREGGEAEFTLGLFSSVLFQSSVRDPSLIHRSRLQTQRKTFFSFLLTGNTISGVTMYHV